MMPAVTSQQQGKAHAHEFFFWEQTCPRKIKDDYFSQRQQILEQSVLSLQIFGFCGTLELHTSSLMSLGLYLSCPMSISQPIHSISVSTEWERIASHMSPSPLKRFSKSVICKHIKIHMTPRNMSGPSASLVSVFQECNG